MELRGRSPLTGGGVEIEVSADRVVRVTPREAVPGDAFVSPGFIDIQVNGYGGIDYSGPELAAGDAARIVGLLEQTGTTTHVPTIITNPQQRILRNLRVIAAAMDDGLPEASIAGIHIEGPYIAAEDGPRGAHDASYVREPSIAEYEAWQEASGGRVTVVTLAPEREGALGFIERLASDGVVVGIGHTAADAGLIAEAVAAGARLSTHLGNGSALYVHRLHNHIWPQLASDELSASVVADGFHVPPEFLAVLARAKGVDRTILMSDVSPLAGYPSGRHRWGGIEVEVFADGHLRVAGTEYLAGAGHLLDRCVAYASAHLGADGMSRAVAGCTINPARLLGLPDFAGGLALGARANIVLFSLESAADRITIERVIRDGRDIAERHDQ